MLGLTLNETCGMANIPQAWTLAAAEDLVGMQLFYSIFSRYSENLIIDLAS